MPTSTVVNATNICLFFGETAILRKVIAHSDSCKISMSAATIKTTSKDSGDWENSIVSRLSWSADNSSYKSVGVDATRLLFDDVMALFLAKTPITVTIGEITGVMPPVLGTTAKVLSGLAIITKLDLDAKDADKATYSISLEGTGPLTNALASA